MAVFYGSRLRLRGGLAGKIPLENKDGSKMQYSLDLSEESDGTRKLMSLAPAIESALQNGGVLLVDELERELHPTLVNFIVSKFQSKNTNASVKSVKKRR